VAVGIGRRKYMTEATLRPVKDVDTIMSRKNVARRLALVRGEFFRVGFHVFAEFETNACKVQPLAFGKARSSASSSTPRCPKAIVYDDRRNPLPAQMRALHRHLRQAFWTGGVFSEPKVVE
jgi:hypothetical protein